MVEWKRIFRLFLFSGILGEAREVHLKFRNEIPENVLSIRSLSGIFGRMESAHCLGFCDCVTDMPVKRQKSVDFSKRQEMKDIKVS